MTADNLPRPYQLLARIVALSAHATVGPDATMRRHPIGDDVARLAQDLAVELWRAGMDEHRAGMGTVDSDYDAHLYCPGLHPDELTRLLGVPTVPPSDPAKDLGRGRSFR